MGFLDDLRRLLGGKSILGGPPANVGATRDAGTGPQSAATDTADACSLDGDFVPGSSGGSCCSTGPSEPQIQPSRSKWDGATTPAVQVLTQGPINDLKRIAKFLTSLGIESQLVMPPGGCGT